MKILVQEKNQIINASEISLFTNECAMITKPCYDLCCEKKDEIIRLGRYNSRKRTQEILTEIIKNKNNYYIMPEK